MNSNMNRCTIVLILLACFLSLSAQPVLANGEQPGEAASGEAVLFDLFVLRPLGFAATMVGLSSFLVALPFTAAGNNTDQVARKLVREPADYTFTRSLGDF